MGARLQRVQSPAGDRGVPCWAMCLDAVSELLGVERSRAERVRVAGCAGWE